MLTSRWIGSYVREGDPERLGYLGRLMISRPLSLAEL